MNGWVCLRSLTALSFTQLSSVELQLVLKTQIVCRRGFRAQTMQILVISLVLIYRGRLKLLKRTCLAIVPPFGPLALPRPRCRLCRGLLKVLNNGLSLTALDAYGESNFVFKACQ